MGLDKSETEEERLSPDSRHPAAAQPQPPSGASGPPAGESSPIWWKDRGRLTLTLIFHQKKEKDDNNIFFQCTCNSKRKIGIL